MGTCGARRVVFIFFALIAVGIPDIGYAAAGDCGQPVSQGALPTATDALFTLKAAVGAGTCALALCDVDGDCSVTATDALRVLTKAVGQPGTFACSCVVSTTTSTTTTTTTTTTSTTTTSTSTTLPSTTTTIVLPSTTTTTMPLLTTTTTVPPSTTTTTMPPGVRLHLENITAQSMELWIDTDLCINAYQFTVSGPTVVGAGGGLTQAAGMSINAGGTLVLVFGFAGEEIGAGSSGQLLQVLFSNASLPPCTGFWVISDCDSLVVPDTSIYFRRVDGSLCRSDEPGCFLCSF